MPADAPDIVHASEIVASAVFLFAAMGTGGASLYVVGRWARMKGRASGLLRDSRRARIAAACILAIGLASAVWGWCVEPRMLRVTTLRLSAPAPAEPLRIAFISDLHVEPGWRMEGRLVRRIAELAPDAILLGGDYMNSCDADSLAMLGDAARGLVEVAPVYAVLGNVDILHDGARGVLPAAGVRVLDGSAVDISPGVRVFGAGYLDAAALARAGAGSDEARFDICLTHAPGIIPEAAAAGFDLLLCGHTHGGQVRMPLWGALLTLSVHGKRFECGRYDVGDMTAYVTRGVGLEGGGLAPRVRFLCPPEIVLLEVVNDTARHGNGNRR